MTYCTLQINIESQDENCTCTEVLKHLKNKSHRNLVPHLWMYTTDKHVYVCTQFVKGKFKVNVHTDKHVYVCTQFVKGKFKVDVHHRQTCLCMHTWEPFSGLCLI